MKRWLADACNASCSCCRLVSRSPQMPARQCHCHCRSCRDDHPVVLSHSIFNVDLQSPSCPVLICHGILTLQGHITILMSCSGASSDAKFSLLFFSVDWLACLFGCIDGLLCLCVWFPTMTRSEGNAVKEEFALST